MSVPSGRLSWEAEAFLREVSRGQGGWVPWHFHLAREDSWMRRAFDELTTPRLVEVDTVECRARLTDVGRAWLTREGLRAVAGLELRR